MNRNSVMTPYYQLDHSQGKLSRIFGRHKPHGTKVSYHSLVPPAKTKLLVNRNWVACLQFSHWIRVGDFCKAIKKGVYVGGGGTRSQPYQHRILNKRASKSWNDYAEHPVRISHTVVTDRLLVWGGHYCNSAGFFVVFF